MTTAVTYHLQRACGGTDRWHLRCETPYSLNSTESLRCEGVRPPGLVCVTPHWSEAPILQCEPAPPIRLPRFLQATVDSVVGNCQPILNPLSWMYPVPGTLPGTVEYASPWQVPATPRCPPGSAEDAASRCRIVLGLKCNRGYVHLEYYNPSACDIPRYPIGTIKYGANFVMREDYIKYVETGVSGLTASGSGVPCDYPFPWCGWTGTPIGPCYTVPVTMFNAGSFRLTISTPPEAVL